MVLLVLGHFYDHVQSSPPGPKILVGPWDPKSSLGVLGRQYGCSIGFRSVMVAREPVDMNGDELLLLNLHVHVYYCLL